MNRPGRSTGIAVLCAAAAISLGGCGTKGTEPFTPVPTGIVLSSSAVTLDAIGATAQLTATVKDQNGNPISGAVPTWTSDNASVATVSMSGLVTAVAAGSTTVHAAAGSAKADASVSVFVGTMSAVAGNNQIGLVGYPVNVRPAVKITGSANTPVSGLTVTFALASGGGSVTGATQTTNSNGVAQVGSWTLGASAGTNTLTATASGAGGSPITFADTGRTGTFDIVIRNVGPALSPAVQAAFDSAAAKWQRIIYQDIPDFPNFSTSANSCTPAVSSTNVDDILIVAKFDSIDGPGGILGQAGPCYIRISSGLPIEGAMVFDTADVATLVANGQLNSVILHEMGHVLGFGTLWRQSPINCLQLPSSSGNVQDTYFSCASARAMFDSIGGTSYTGGNKVPVENCGSQSPAGCDFAGTANGHWRETTFDNELMTGFLNTGIPNPLSRLTVASFGDEGYVVNYAGADPYTRTFTLRLAGGQGLVSLGNDIRRTPIYVLDQSGRVVDVIQPNQR